MRRFLRGRIPPAFPLAAMKKISLLLGTLGGALGGYLLSNSKLREGLLRAKDPEHAAKLLGRHLQQDGKRLAKEVQTFVQSDDVRANLKKAKKFALQTLGDAKRQVEGFVCGGASSVRAPVKRKAGKPAKGFRTTEVR